MLYNRETEADRVGKAVAKKAAKKAASKYGKKAASAAAKMGMQALNGIWTLLCSTVGLPVAIGIVGLALLMFVLPSSIFSSTMGADMKNTDDLIVDNPEVAEWETDAENALEERKTQLEQGAFWSDLKTLLTTGQWGKSEETFKTEYANADDVNDKTGKSVSSGYFSASNRIIAVIDEAFRASCREDTKAMKQAKKAAQDKETEYRTSASTLYPQPDYASEYVVNFSVKRDDNIDQNHYIYEACYILAASSVGFQQDDAYEHTVRDILDYTFDITGLDDKGEEQQICWLPSVNPSYETKEEEYIKDWIPNPDDPEGDPIPKYGTRYIVNITANYSVTLSSTFRDMVNDKCGLEDLPDDAPSYDMSTKDLANLSAVELMKFYSVGGNADLGDVGLPLPSRSYYISSPFGDRELNGAQQNHKGVDLAAAYGTQVYAVKDGTAQVPGYSNSYGNYVTITHEGGTKTRYAHMSSVVVSDGQEVTAGQVIGYVGSTGDSTGNHLHFEVINPSGQRIDPMQTEVGVLIDANKTH